MKEINKVLNKNLCYVLYIFIVSSISSLVTLEYVYTGLHLPAILKIVRLMCYAFFAIYTVINYKKLSFLDVFLIFLGLLIAYFSKNKNIIVLAFILISFKEQNIDKVLKQLFYLYIIIFLLVLISSFIGILPDWIYNRGDTARHSLGFIYPTDCHSMFLSIVLLYTLSFKNKIHNLNLFVLEIINISLYHFTNGRMGLYLITFLIIILAVFHNIAKFKIFFINILKNSKIKLIFQLFPFILCILFFFMSILYGKNCRVINKADDLLSSRIKYTSEALKNYKITLFGKEIKWYGWGGYGYIDNINVKTFEYNYVDSSYPRMVLDYGLILTIVVLCAYSYLIYFSLKHQKYYMFLVLNVVLLWSFIEPYIINLQRNIIVIYFTVILKRFSKPIFKRIKLQES